MLVDKLLLYQCTIYCSALTFVLRYDEQGSIRWGIGETGIALHTALFPSLLFSEGAFSGLVNSLVLENFPGGTPLDPQIPTVLLADEHIKHCSSGKDFSSL